MAKLSISIPDEVLRKLDESASKLGLTRSAFLTMAVSEKMKQDEVMEFMPKMLEQMKLAKAIQINIPDLGQEK